MSQNSQVSKSVNFASSSPITDTIPDLSSRKAAQLRAGLSQTVAAAADLLEEGDRAHAGVASDARDLLLDEIEPDPAQPRRHFDAISLQSLADDIERRGVLQPVLVRPPERLGDKHRLVAGERRWRAARLAGRVRIPARVRAMSDEDVQAAQLAENVLRADLSDIEKGRALRRLYELRKSQNYKATWEDIATEVGLGRARIHDLFNLALLPEPVAALIGSGRLSGSHGIALQRAQEALGSDAIVSLAERAARPEAKRIGGFALSVAQLRATIQQLTRSETEDVPSNGLNGTSHSPPAIQEIKPFVQQVAAAAAAGSLTVEERNLLLQVLSQPLSSPTDGETELPMRQDQKTPLTG